MPDVRQGLRAGTTDYGPQLSSQHAAMLRESAVHPDVAAERGYRTVTDTSELIALGFKHYQAGPGLLVPIHTVGTERVRYQLRRETPRLDKRGKPIKYESPAGQRNVLDTPRRVHDALRDPGVPLHLTEGAKKVDALISHGAVAVGLAGVYGFLGTNERGGKTVLACWREIALNERLVYIAFDSDVTTKPSVYEALRELKSFLEHRGADVWVINLSQAASSAKTGVDDYLAAGGDLEELRQRATREIPSAPRAESVEVDLTKEQRRYLDDPKVRRLLHGQCDEGDDPRPHAIDFRFVMHLALKGCRASDSLNALLRHRLIASDRPLKAADDAYIARTVAKALECAEALVLERVDVTLSIDEIVRLVPEDNALETTYRVTGVSGWTAEVGQSTLLDMNRMRGIVLAETGRLPDEVRKRNWEDHLSWVLTERTRVEIIPAELSEFGLLRQAIVTVLSGAPRWFRPPTGMEDVEEIIAPFPHENDDGEVLTTFPELVKALRTELPSLNPSPNMIGRALRWLGANPDRSQAVASGVFDDVRRAFGRAAPGQSA